MGFFINEHQHFSGNATDLANLASQCAHYLQLPGDLDKINERIVRYYVAEGLVARPERIGRDAQYGYKHLLQFLAGRLLVENGYPMQKVAPYLMSENLDKLETLVMTKTVPSMAEILVASFQNPGAQQTKRSQLERPHPSKDSIRNVASTRRDSQRLSFMEQIEKAEQRSQDSMSFSISNSISDAVEQVSHSYDSMDEMVDLGQQSKTNEQLIAIGETLKAGMHDIYKRQGESTQALRAQIEELRQELERTRFDMEGDRMRSFTHFEILQKEIQHQNLLIEEILNQLLAANAQQCKGKENE
ncbi:MerR family transcriptional regulator [Polynucleobacter sp. AM-7D1]|uniref:MerR family transcriptional regulator n=1 Tax=Polynucleobacter sp. AM-7D1 TaxID=2689102 RepID=UPI001BFE3C10|nr:MerR family transcriptional regulator [Polynucleobacter sp. AM-7D1]QWE27909.1 MerR family transcriptional regulator [Polynucleobacter sp. AM-7D1]